MAWDEGQWSVTGTLEFLISSLVREKRLNIYCFHSFTYSLTHNLAYASIIFFENALYVFNFGLLIEYKYIYISFSFSVLLDPSSLFSNFLLHGSVHKTGFIPGEKLILSFEIFPSSHFFPTSRITCECLVP